MKPGDVARIGDQHVLAAERHEDEAVRRQRKDVIQRQRRHDHLAPVLVENRPQPRARLQHVRDDVPVQRASRPSRRRSCRPCTAGTRGRRGRSGRATASACGPAVIASVNRIAPGSDHFGIAFFTRRSTKSTMRPLNASSSPIDVTTIWRIFVRATTCCSVCAKFSTTTITSAPESTSWCSSSRARVERIHVHDRAAGAQRAEQADRVLQDVGHHQRDARALRAADALQPCAERRRQRVELGERDRAPHARERRPRGERAAALLEHLAHRRVFVDVDLRRNAGRIVLEPDPVHGCLRRGHASRRSHRTGATLRRLRRPGAARVRSAAGRRETARTRCRRSRRRRPDRHRRRCRRRAPLSLRRRADR